MDTAHVDLGDCRRLVDLLARNAHDVWAQMRLNDGWAYGPERDDRRKLHPCLVRFEEMPEPDQAFDRAMIAEFLRAAMLLGFRR
jgi:RyR domain